VNKRRSYPIEFVINGRQIQEVVIDPHFEKKHPDINDKLILDLVRHLDGREFQPEDRTGDWEYFMLDRIHFNQRLYRLIWCLRDDCLFIGVINCFRRDNT
jgi:hypothetical protein